MEWYHKQRTCWLWHCLLAKLLSVGTRMGNAQWECRCHEKYDGGAYMNQTWHKAFHCYPSCWLGTSDKLEVGGVSGSRYKGRICTTAPWCSSTEKACAHLRNSAQHWKFWVNGVQEGSCCNRPRVLTYQYALVSLWTGRLLRNDAWTLTIRLWLTLVSSN